MPRFRRRKQAVIVEPVLTLPGLDAIQRDLVRQYNANKITYEQLKERLAHINMARDEIKRAEEQAGRSGAMVALPRNAPARQLVNNPYFHPGDNPYFQPDDEHGGASRS